jgi:hypothetical protein
MELVDFVLALAVPLLLDAIKIGLAIQIYIYKGLFWLVRKLGHLIWWLLKLTGRGVAGLFKWVGGKLRQHKRRVISENTQANVCALEAPKETSASLH